MLLLITVIAGIALFSAIRAYSRQDHKLPDASTPEGKKARIVVGSALLVFIVLLIFNAAGKGIEGISSWIVAFILGGSIPVFRYIQYKNKQK